MAPPKQPPNILPSLFSRFFMGRGAAGGDFAVVPFPAPEGETRDADGLPSPVPGFGCGFFACGAPLGFKPTGTGAFFFFFSRSFSDAAASAFGSFPFSAVFGRASPSPFFPGDSSDDADFCFFLVAGATAASRLGGGGGIGASVGSAAGQASPTAVEESSAATSASPHSDQALPSLSSIPKSAGTSCVSLTHLTGAMPRPRGLRVSLVLILLHGARALSARAHAARNGRRHVPVAWSHHALSRRAAIALPVISLGPSLVRADDPQSPPEPRRSLYLVMRVMEATSQEERLIKSGESAGRAPESAASAS